MYLLFIEKISSVLHSAAAIVFIDQHELWYAGVWRKVA